MLDSQFQVLQLARDCMRWDQIDQQRCSIARSLSVVGERWTLLILRDAFLGTRRFDKFQQNLGITRHRLSERLSKLVKHSVLVKVQYNNRPPRYEYRLTRKGLALYPVLMSLVAWGDEWMNDGMGPPLELVHLNCGEKIHAVASCSTCGEPLRPEEVRPQLGPALMEVAARLESEGECIEEIQSLIRHS